MPSNEKLDTRRKALTLNLDPSTFGSFAEIGAGQEVARWLPVEIKSAWPSRNFSWLEAVNTEHGKGARRRSSAFRVHLRNVYFFEGGYI